MAPERIPVCFIMGASRSGSTIADILLGQHPDVESLGELRELPRRVWRQNDLCACGSPVHDCELWPRVFDEWCQATGERDFERYRAAQEGIVGLRSWMKWRHLASGEAPQFEQLRRWTVELYRSILKVTGKRMVVDSSKSPGLALLLASTTEFDAHLVHLVRDGRGVVASFKKAFDRQPDAGLQKTIRPKPVWQSMLRWTLVNRTADWVGRTEGARSTVVRYEDLVSHPIDELTRIGAALGIDYSTTATAAANGGVLAPGHLVAGNRIRMRRDLRLRPADRTWEDQLTGMEAALCNSMARSALRRYGYR